LGYQSNAYTPTYRGFDTYTGYYSGAEEHFTHYKAGEGKNYFDLANNSGNSVAPLFSMVGKTQNETEEYYSVYVYGNETVRLIKRHAALYASSPLYVYLAWNVVHAPDEAPAWAVDLNPEEKNGQRQLFAGMLSALDVGVRHVIDELKAQDMWEKTIVSLRPAVAAPACQAVRQRANMAAAFPLLSVAFRSLCSVPTTEATSAAAGTTCPYAVANTHFGRSEAFPSCVSLYCCQWPCTPAESCRALTCCCAGVIIRSCAQGGTRGVGFIHSPLLGPNPPPEWHGLMHAVDWYTTFAGLAGASVENTGPLPADGINIWDDMKANQTDPSRHMIIQYLHAPRNICGKISLSQNLR
jgi:hypothetical protein